MFIRWFRFDTTILFTNKLVVCQLDVVFRGHFNGKFAIDKSLDQSCVLAGDARDPDDRSSGQSDWDDDIDGAGFDGAVDQTGQLADEFTHKSINHSTCQLTQVMQVRLYIVVD